MTLGRGRRLQGATWRATRRGYFWSNRLYIGCPKGHFAYIPYSHLDVERLSRNAIIIEEDDDGYDSACVSNSNWGALELGGQELGGHGGPKSHNCQSYLDVETLSRNDGYVSACITKCVSGRQIENQLVFWQTNLEVKWFFNLKRTTKQFYSLKQQQNVRLVTEWELTGCHWRGAHEQAR